MNFFFILTTFDKHDKTLLLAKFKKILYMVFRATLNFRNGFQVLAGPMVGKFFDIMIVASSDKEWL